eukprot:TRINITY_DN4442_c0_g1_i1.p2 TRINITY_DN4442_c0_g1~~TRINITY_DN4442_c0_g1_i1.p2  ORF type:complete len:257 (-),score=69.08 TRINITY_DN4442_c0_g1_i1:1182-1952(-)
MAKPDEQAKKPAWGDNEDATARKEKIEEMMMVPGEVTSRRKQKVSKEEAQKATEEYVSMEWDEIFPKKPKERLRWLDKALRAGKEGRVKTRPLFDIIAHRRFLEGLKGQVATDCLNLIRGSLDLFSHKQQKQLTSDNFELFRKYAPINVLDSDEDENDAPPLPPPPKVIIEEKGKRKKKQDTEVRRRRDDSDEGDSNDDVETKRQKILSKGIERRVDPVDGQAYTLAEFCQEYGGSMENPPDQWANQRLTAFVFKS